MNGAIPVPVPIIMIGMHSLSGNLKLVILVLLKMGINISFFGDAINDLHICSRNVEQIPFLKVPLGEVYVITLKAKCTELECLNGEDAAEKYRGGRGGRFSSNFSKGGLHEGYSVNNSNRLGNSPNMIFRYSSAP